jgi:uncharacterized membrane protein YkvA (DUF1232 family)
VKDLLLALPRLARMLVSLVADRDVPTAAKVVLAALAVYLASPVDLIPDFLPWLGYLDDVLLAAIVVDGILTMVDRTLLLRYWPGSADSLERVAATARRLARWVPRRIKARIFGEPRAPLSLPAARGTSERLPLSPQGRGQGEG